MQFTLQFKSFERNCGVDWRRGDAGTRGRGDAGTRGRGDAGTRGGSCGLCESLRSLSETRRPIFTDCGDTTLVPVAEAIQVGVSLKERKDSPRPQRSSPRPRVALHSFLTRLTLFGLSRPAGIYFSFLM